MYAIIKNGGKQYKVQEGDVLNLDKMSLEPEATIEIKEVLAVNAGELKMGAPYVDGAVVTAEVISEGRDKKVVIFKKRRRKDSKVKRGFRRDHTRVRITKIAA
ncbi:50S ribosomal protein L21 [Sulfurimonas sp.]|uniref:50S ribosomal protein L21 n=1 Tax=Sulfurimonas sp. TaxID=2022749 RepID=UPI003D14FC45